VRLTKDLPVSRVPLDEIRELDERWAGDDGRGTWREMAEHIRLIEAADLSYPIILSAEGRVMDGMHRTTKALLQGRDSIDAVRFDVDPPPDHVGLGPDDLSYDEEPWPPDTATTC
jgi:hypothetical protein